MATPVDPGKQPYTGTTGERTIGQLVSDVSTDLSQIMRGEIELAKAEIKQDVSHAGKGAGMFAGAGVLALYGLGLLLLGLAGVIAIWLSWWAGLLIVAAVLFLVAGILALIGKKQITQVKGKPEKAITQAQRTVETLKTAPAQLKGPPTTGGAPVPASTSTTTSV
ncbi:phage holin family protein [Ornithinimicrobium sp. W1665]|uniref:phage holin family protein n=1 Tax=Ornithinimicrobium sp. W1665 TaxID=3416666 RepID=UPI003CF83846